MTALLCTDQEAFAGALVGPSEPRYELLERIVAPDDPDKFSMDGVEHPPTVWRARRLSDDATVVVKVNSQSPGGDPGYEAQRLWRTAGYTDGRQGGAQYENTLCVVLEPLGPSMEEWRRARPLETFPVPVVRRLIRQVLLALDYLHWEVHCTHGALTLDNVLLASPFPVDELARDAPLPTPAVKLILLEWGRERAEKGIGWVALPEHPYDDLSYHSPNSRATAAPEHRFMNYRERAGPADAHDIWAVGVMVSLLLFNQDISRLVPRSSYKGYRRPYNSRFVVEGGMEVHHLPDEVIIDYASLDPDAGWPTWFSTSDSDDPDITGYTDFPFFLSGVSRMPNIRERIEATQLVPDGGEADSLASFLRACWTLNPFKRPKAKELLAHEWLRGVE
ncbi:hypothetical protein JCM10450v2_003613 [Rhodotorula kratochvilovae]